MEINADLISDMARQRVVLFLGAGVSSSAKTGDGKGIMGWHDFLESAAEKAGGEIENQVKGLLEEKDYLLSCEILQSYFGDEWEDLVVAEFGKAATPSDLHRKILSLKQRIVLTTNFDKLLEAAWAENPIDGVRYPLVISKIEDRMFRSLKDHDGSYLIKIHGTVDKPDEIVFSRSQYIKNAFGNAQYSDFLEALLLNYTFLFIGFSMADPAITSLMELYALRYPSARPHYILSSDDHPQNIIDINKKLRRLSIIKYDGKNHHAELPGIIESIGGLAAARRKEIFSTLIA